MSPIAILKRAIQWIATLWLAVTLVFFALRIVPGDAVQSDLTRAGYSPAVIEDVRAEMGLSAPPVVQYFDYMTDLIRGDFGISLYSGLPVLDLIGQRLPSTLALALWSIIIAVMVGISLGALAGFGFASPIRRTGALLIDLSISVPVYWTATLVLFVFLATENSQSYRSLVAASVLGFHTAGAIARVMQVNLEMVHQMPALRTAHAKGLSSGVIARRHIAPLIASPIITIIALQLGNLAAGAVLVESIFQRAGLGTLLVDRVIAQDYPVVQGIVVVIATFFIGSNAVADTLITLLDPRQRSR